MKSILLAEPISASEAMAAGLVAAVVSPEELLPHCLAIAGHFTAENQQTIKFAKQAICRGALFFNFMHNLLFVTISECTCLAFLICVFFSLVPCSGKVVAWSRLASITMSPPTYMGPNRDHGWLANGC